MSLSLNMFMAIFSSLFSRRYSIFPFLFVAFLLPLTLLVMTGEIYQINFLGISSSFSHISHIWCFLCLFSAYLAKNTLIIQKRGQSIKIKADPHCQYQHH